MWVGKGKNKMCLAEIWNPPPVMYFNIDIDNYFTLGDAKEVVECIKKGKFYAPRPNLNTQLHTDKSNKNGNR